MEHLRADQARQLALKPADARIDKRFEGVDQELVGLKAGLTALEIAVGRPGPAASIAFCPGVTSSTERVRAVLNAIVMS